MPLHKPLSTDVPGKSLRTLLKLLIVIVMHRHEQVCVLGSGIQVRVRHL